MIKLYDLFLDGPLGVAQGVTGGREVTQQGARGITAHTLYPSLIYRCAHTSIVREED
jgi:hypothetical protein